MSDIFLIAGEPSGDVLGARLMHDLREKGVRFEGVGGAQMQAQGLKSLVPMEELCVMGVFEVIKDYPRLRKLAYRIIEEVEQRQPDVLVTIDLPDFNFAIAKKLKQRGRFKGKIIHYVAPTVWAWRPGRAKKIAKFLDGLMCLFPFEPPYFTKHGLKAVFVGHPLTQSGIDQGDGTKFRDAHGIDKSAQTFGVFFGSRISELERHGAVFRDVAQNLTGMHVIAPTLPHLKDKVETLLEGISHTIITDPEEKADAFAAMNVALAVSGTVGLELAYAGIPHVIAYKMNPVTWKLVKLLVKTKYAHLANILLRRAAVPEFLQSDCEAGKITEGLQNTLYNAKKLEEDFGELRGVLGEVAEDAASRFVNKAAEISLP